MATWRNGYAEDCKSTNSVSELALLGSETPILVEVFLIIPILKLWTLQHNQRVKLAPS